MDLSGVALTRGSVRFDWIFCYNPSSSGVCTALLGQLDSDFELPNQRRA